MNKKILLWVTLLPLGLNGCLSTRQMNGMIHEMTNGRLMTPAHKTNQIFPHTPTGNDSYSQGWINGCKTAASQQAEGFYRLVKPVFDAERLSSDAWYLRGFQDAQDFCTLSFDWETH